MAFMRSPLYILMQDGVVQMFKDWSHGLVTNQDLFDEIVMMRYYNMTEHERHAAIDRVLNTQFETGADGLRKASGLPTVMGRALEEALDGAKAGDVFYLGPFER